MSVDGGETATARTTLLRNGAIHSRSDPSATAMVVQGGTIAWIGAESAAAGHADGVDEVVDLRGALVTPAFVDAHVHATMTGVSRAGLDLAGCASSAELLDRVAAHAADLPADSVVIGTGWDETLWADRAVPTPDELDRAAGGRKAYLSRVDVHSALVSATLLAAVPGARDAAGYEDGGPLARKAHHEVRQAALGSITPSQREEAQRTTLRAAAALGIGALHECGGPQISGEADFTTLLALAAAEPSPYVFGYWGELTDPVKAIELGAVGAGGDLFIDGAIGSHTACLREAYSDAADEGRGELTPAGHAGAAYLTAEEIGAFLISSVEAGVQPGFHVIGDYGLDLLTAGLGMAHDVVGERRLRAVRVRAEHAEMADADHLKAFARHGVAVSAQPGFDAAWGGPDGMYARRLGAARAEPMNPFADMAEAGIILAFGSDSPVIPLGPWEAVRAAAFHRTPSSRMFVAAAFSAHTRGGWQALRPGTAGVPAREEGAIEPGSPATYAVWRAGELIAQAPDGTVADSSTDTCAGTPSLPDLSPGADLPVCLRTVVGGRVIHDTPDQW